MKDEEEITIEILEMYEELQAEFQQKLSIAYKLAWLSMYIHIIGCLAFILAMILGWI